MASKTVSTTGEGTIVGIPLGIVGAVIGDWLFNLLGGKGVGGFNMDSVYSAGVVAAGGAIVTLAAVITSFYVAACCETRRAGLIPPGPTVSVSVPRAT